MSDTEMSPSPRNGGGAHFTPAPSSEHDSDPAGQRDLLISQEASKVQDTLDNDGHGEGDDQQLESAHPKVVIQAPTRAGTFASTGTSSSSDDDELHNRGRQNRASTLTSYTPTTLKKSDLESLIIIPKVIPCHLYVTFSNHEKPVRPAIHHEFAEFQWQEKDSYIMIETACKEEINKFQSQSNGKSVHTGREVYLRHGCCTIKGEFDAPKFNLDTCRFTADTMHMRAVKEVCRFIAEQDVQRLELEIRCDYGSGLEQGPTKWTHKNLIKRHCRAKLGIPNKTIQDQDYISRADIDELTKPRICHAIVDEDNGFGDDIQKKTIKNMIDQKPAQTFLVACIWTDVPAHVFKHFLLDHNYHDGNLPRSHDRCQIAEDDQDRFECDDYSQKLAPVINKFFAHFVVEDRDFVELDNNEIMPISYDNPEKKFIGEGFYSNVAEVRIDINHRAGEFSSGYAETYALKIFKNDIQEDRKKEAFKTELRALLYLSRYPHPHILTHITSWEQRETFYILYDKADSNLYDYMLNTKSKSLTKARVIWFLDQLAGLADAVRKIHQLEEASKEKQSSLHPRRARKTGIVGYHHDIKPANILCFSRADQDPILKLSDFGTGKFSKVRLEQSTGQATSTARGTLTYFGPEYAVKAKKSRPFDMWALGCVFLEALLWFLDLQEPFGQGTFSNMRLAGIDSDSAQVDFFWTRTWPQHSTAEPSPKMAQTVNKGVAMARNLGLKPIGNDPKYRGYTLNPTVAKFLHHLDNDWCWEMRAFQSVVHLIRGLLEVSPEERLVAPKLWDKLDGIRAQAKVDMQGCEWNDEEKCFFAQQFKENRARKLGTLPASRPNPRAWNLLPPDECAMAEASSSIEESSVGSARHRSLQDEQDQDRNDPPSDDEPRHDPGRLVGAGTIHDSIALRSMPSTITEGYGPIPDGEGK